MSKLKARLQYALIYLFPAVALVLSLFAKETSQAARQALYLCLDVVIPSLFPFFVLSGLAVPLLSRLPCPRLFKAIMQKGFGLPYYTLVTLMLGYLSGYPTGAKLARDMMDEGLLDSVQAGRVITYANNCSPLFVIGTIGAGLFQSIRIGFVLLVVHWIAGLTAALLLKHFLKEPAKEKAYPSHINTKPASSGPSLPFAPAIENASFLCIKVTGYIVLFAVLSELLGKLGLFQLLGNWVGWLAAQGQNSSMSGFFTSLFRGVMEISTGASAVSQVQDTSLTLKLAGISFLCGFAGLSVHTQVMGIMRGTGTKYITFFIGKLLHGILAFCLTLPVMNMFPFALQTAGSATQTAVDLSPFRALTVTVLLLSLLIYIPDVKRASSRKKA